jgi:hypothetical protein
VLTSSLCLLAGLLFLFIFFAVLGFEHRKANVPFFPLVIFHIGSCFYLGWSLATTLLPLPPILLGLQRCTMAPDLFFAKGLTNFFLKLASNLSLPVSAFQVGLLAVLEVPVYLFPGYEEKKMEAFEK